MLDVLFVTPSDKLKLKSEVNGVLLLATKLLHNNFNVKILRFSEIVSYNTTNYLKFIHEMVDSIVGEQPKCVSFYTLWPHYHVILRISSELKKIFPDTIIVFGGPQAGLTAYQTLLSYPFVDYICSGEGEDTVVPFFYSLLRNQGIGLDMIPSLWYRINNNINYNNLEHPLCNLDSLPHWDVRLIHPQMGVNEDDICSENYFMPIDAGRGCPYSCTFCCTNNFWRRTYRLKSPERIVDDILYYYSNFGIRSFWFSHDAFTINKELVGEVCDKIINQGLPITWKCTTRIDCISKELLLKMKSSGLTAIELGIETGSQRMQKIINKNLNLVKALEMVDFLLDNNIKVGLFFMYGFPDETIEDLNQTLNLLFDLIDKGVHYASASFCRFNPQTAITEERFNDLVLDKNIKVLSRAIWGYEQEIEMIQNNKTVFSHFYHLSTELRDEFQYVVLLNYLYKTYNIAMKHLRVLYNGDAIQLYRDFVNSNLSMLKMNIDSIVTRCSNQPMEIFEALVKKNNWPCMTQLLSLFEYTVDLRIVRNAQSETKLKKKYNFNYIDFKLDLPIDKYSNGSTTIEMEKNSNVFSMRVIDINNIDL